MSTKKSLYKIALDGQGYILAQPPSERQRPMGDLPVFGQYPDRVDIEWHDASPYLPWAQTDWALGFQQEKWKDEAKYKAGENIDPFDEYGALKLLNTHSAVLSFPSGHTFGGAREVWNQKLYVGTHHATLAKLYSIDEEDTTAEITTGWTNINKVNSATVNQDKLIVGLSRASGAEHTIQAYNGSAFADIEDTYDEISMVVSVGERLYASGLVSAAEGYNLIFTDDQSDWTTRVVKFGRNRKPIAGIDYAGLLYYLVEDYPATELWVEDGTDTERIYRWNNLVNADIVEAYDKVIISGEQSGKVVAFDFDGATIRPSFEERVSGLALHSRYLTEWGTDVWLQALRYDGQIWVSGHKIQYGSNNCYPIANFGHGNTHMFFCGIDGSTTKISRIDKDTYASSGWFTTGLYYGLKPALDKLWYSVDLSFESLSAGDSIKVEYSVDREANWTSLGTATTAGADSHTFLFPENTTSRFIQLRITLYSGDGTTTPILNDFVGRFIILPDFKQRWKLDLKCTDEMQLLDRKSKEQNWGEDLRNKLRIARWKNQVVDFEDIDYFECVLVDDPLSSAAVTAEVDEVPPDAP